MLELPRLFAEPVGLADAQRLAAAFKAFADPARLQILSLLIARREMTVTDLIVAMDRLSQPTVSHHLRLLVDAGLASRRKQGVWVFYRAEHRAFRAMSDAIRPGRGR